MRTAGMLCMAAALLVARPGFARADAYCDHVEDLKPIGELLGE